MDQVVQIDADFVEKNTDFAELVSALRSGFRASEILVPARHHHDFPNPNAPSETTLLLMPAWCPGQNAGVKIVTICPDNGQFDLPAVQGTYLYLDATTGTVKAIIEAKSLTAKRTAAASALASTFLSVNDASSLLMIGTGMLAPNLIRAHASVRPIRKVYVWGRNPEKATAVCDALQNESFDLEPVSEIHDVLGLVDIVSTATLSKTPLVAGNLLKPGQHLDLVGAYRKDMRESDNATMARAVIFVDTFQGLAESGDIATPMSENIIGKSDLKADLFQLCSGQRKGRTDRDEITVFKSVGHALEDLVAANYYFEKYRS